MNNIYIQINNNQYPLLSVTEQINDIDWDFRNTKTLYFEDMTYEQINNIFSNANVWNIIEKTSEIIYNEETGEIIDTIIKDTIIDNSKYIIPGPITDYKNNIISIKMGELTNLEEAYMLLYGDKENEK